MGFARSAKLEEGWRAGEEDEKTHKERKRKRESRVEGELRGSKFRPG